MRTNTTSLLSFIAAICLISSTAFAQSSTPWDQPESATTFKGELTGQVKWIPQHTQNYFVMVVDSVKPETVSAEEHADLIGKSVQVGAGTWVTPTTPDADQVAYINTLAPGQKISITVWGTKDKAFRFKVIPK